MIKDPQNWRPGDAAKPSTPSNEELTQRMEIAPETQARLVKLVNNMCEVSSLLHHSKLNPLFDEAHALKADLPKPVDPNEALAHEIYAAAQVAPGEGIEDAVARICLTLAAGGTAHE